MKHTYIIIVLIMSVSACSGNKSSKKNDKETITVSIAPLKYIVEQIVGNDFNISILVPSGSSPETFEANHKQLLEVNNSIIMFTTGLIDFESQLTEKLQQSVDIIKLSEGINVIAGTCSHAGHQHGVDPHIWTSPKLLKKIALNVHNHLTLLYPDSIKYGQNYIAISQKLDSLDSLITHKIANSNTKSFIIYHPALTYYAQDYGIEQISIEENGKEPSASHLKKLIDNARKNNIKKVYYQAQFSQSTVEAFAKEIGATTVEIDPLSENVYDNLLYITGVIFE